MAVLADGLRCRPPALAAMTGLLAVLLVPLLLLASEAALASGSSADQHVAETSSTDKYAMRLEQALQRDLKRPAVVVPAVDVDWLAQRSEQVLVKPEQRNVGLLEQIRAMLQRWLLRNVDDNDWLKGLVDQLRISEQLADILFWSMSALIIALALWIVVRELRLLNPGSFARRRRGRGADSVADDAVGQWPPPLDELPLAQRLPMLLQSLTRGLQSGGWLSTLPGRSNAYYSAELRRRGFVEAPSFARIQQQVDAQVYGGSSASDTELREFLKVAERIHDQAKAANE